MKRIFWVSAAVLAIFALSLNAIAQPQGGGQGRGQGQGQQRPGQGFQAGGQMMPGQMGGQTTPQALLRNAEVVKLLALTEEQTTALNAVIRPQRPAGAEGAAPGTRPAPGQDGAGPGRAPQVQMTPEQRAEFAAQQRQRTTEMWTEIDKILGADKATQFKEIYFQANVPVAAPNAPADAPVRVMNLDLFLLAVVGLTDDQKTKIVAVIDKRDADAAASTRPAQGDDMTAFRTATIARNTKAHDDIKALLTEEQKKKVDELTAGAAKVRTDLNLNVAPGRGTGATPGQRREQGAGGAEGGFRPGGGTGDNFQPGAGRNRGAGGRSGGGN